MAIKKYIIFFVVGKIILNHNRSKPKNRTREREYKDINIIEYINKMKNITEVLSTLSSSS